MDTSDVESCLLGHVQGTGQTW